MRNFTLLLLLTISYLFSTAQPANNDCASAILLSNVNNFCSANAAGTLTAATDDGYGAPSCWTTGAINDVWYKFVATATDVTIVINGNQGSPVGGTLNRPQIVMYTGTCGGTITEVAGGCASAPAGQNIVQLYRGGLTVGQTYLIRVDGANAGVGTFQYCINNYNPVPVPSSDCPTAVVLCDKSSFTVPSVSGAGTNNTEMNDALCFGGGTIESNSTWYAMTFSTAGTFYFTITPSNPNDDIDFAVYKLPGGIGNCAGKTVQRCMASAPLCTPGGANANTSTTGLSPTAGYNDEYSGCNADIAYLFCGIGAARCQSQFVKELTVAAGETYAIAINNFTSTGNGFNMTFGGTAQIQGPVAIINDSDADDQICPGEAITFTDASTPPPAGTITNWTWNFGVGASPATFTGQNPPIVTYSTLGVKTISLTVKSNRGCLITSTKTITVANVPPTVSIVASQNPICASTNVTFTATPTNAGAAPAYQWFLNNNPVGTNSNTYSNAGLINNDQVKVQVTSNSACNLGSQAMSNIVIMTISAPLAVSVNITGTASICQGVSTTLTANPTNGGVPTYQWFVNGNPVGTNSNTYASSVYTNGDIVTVRLTSNLGCVSGNPATSSNFPITVKPNPNVTVNSPGICRNQSTNLSASGATSYTWTGGLASTANPSTGILTTTTTYTVTGTTAGCTNTAVSTVTVTPLPTVTVNSPGICRNQSANLSASGATSYTWTGGLSSTANPSTGPLTTTTTYTVTGTTSGCTNTAVSTVTVTPLPTVTVNSPGICRNQSANLSASGATSYTWTGGLASTANPNTGPLTTTTTYTVSGTTSGCTNTAVSTVTVTPLPTVTVNSPGICRNQSANLSASGATSYTWTGGLASTANPNTGPLTTTTTYTVTGTTSGCTNTAVSTVTVTPLPTVTVNSPGICRNQSTNLSASGATSYTWTGGLASTANPSTGPLTTTTTYTVTGTTSGCTNTAVSTVTVTPLPTVTVNSPGICRNQSANLSASGATSYTWTGGLASTANPSTGPLTTTTTYTVTGTTAGCTNTAVSTVTVTPLPTVTVNSPGICRNQSANLSASGATSYTWTGGLASTANPSTGPLTTTTTYTVTGTTSGCTGTAVSSVTVTPVSTPSVTIVENKNDICSGEQVVFTATPMNTGSTINYQWFVNGNNTGSNSDQFSTNTLNDGDSVKVEISTSGNCLTTTTSTSNVIAMKVNSVSDTIPDIEYCKGKNAVVDLNISPSFSSVFWKNGTDTITTNTDNFIVNNTVNSNLQFTIKFGNGCTKSGVVPIKVNPLPLIDAVVNKPDAKFEEEVQLNVNGSGTLQYNWLPADLVSADSIRNPTTIIKETTLFIVQVKDGNECENADSVLVRLIDECTEDFIYVPTAFSPNRDGINDCFGIITPPALITDYKMVIFDRWGEKVFEASEKDDCWDGLFKGINVQSDTYMYLISFKCHNGKKLSKKGAVTILR